MLALYKYIYTHSHLYRHIKMSKHLAAEAQSNIYKNVIIIFFLVLTLCKIGNVSSKKL